MEGAMKVITFTASQQVLDFSAGKLFHLFFCCTNINWCLYDMSERLDCVYSVICGNNRFFYFHPGSFISVLSRAYLLIRRTFVERRNKGDFLKNQLWICLSQSVSVFLIKALSASHLHQQESFNCEASQRAHNPSCANDGELLISHCVCG